MNDLTILHLSDLHFSKNGAKPYKMFDALLQDIKNELCYAEHIVIVVTGDLIDKADYKCKPLVLKFFDELKNVIDGLPGELAAIFFVPGNHDKERTFAMGILGEADAEYDDKYHKKFIKYFKEADAEYLKLVNEILAKFSMPPRKETYSVEELKIEENYYSFILMDTAWGAKGDKDKRNLKVGKFQIEELQDQYKKKHEKRKEKDAITFALSHHPLNWLDGSEEDLVRNFLIGQRGVDADIMICGHTHTRDIINWSNNRCALTTLSTGIGWPDSFESDHSEVHSYAIYVFHLELNTLDVYVRSTNDGGVFMPDYRIYTREENRKNNKIVLPIKSTQMISYIALSSTAGRSPKVCFLSNAFLQDIQKFVFAMGCFRQFATENMLSHVQTLSQELMQYENSNNLSEKAELEAVFNQFFFDFLQTMCDLLAVEILGAIEAGETKEQQEFKIRFHFRYCSNYEKRNELKDEELIYSKLCLTYWPNTDSQKIRKLSDRHWGELIEAAYKAKQPLIFSANPEYCTTSTEWKDFITIIPDLPENDFYILRQHVEEGRPFLTFGASIYVREYKNILYCLDYYRFDKILSTLLQRYISRIPISMEKFILFAKNKLNEQEAH